MIVEFVLAQNVFDRVHECVRACVRAKNKFDCAIGIGARTYLIVQLVSEQEYI